ncbi:MAG: type II toxin-antitoxin system RelE/ParE family toxin [Gammaproteobacteria bacterium]
MAAHQLVIAPAAKNDLKDIYQYGLRQWGQVRTDRYLATIKDQFWSLKEQPLMGVERPELLPDVRSLLQSHPCFTELPPAAALVTLGASLVNSC